ncbi:hypothetical protein [Alkalicoccus daliensis]|uniref:Uncharacterized protein n=1 Tax=Alkalicoccus daliensis TaxID=745820 RepID=A0A1G9ZDC1_9BACI|nr:hypothetical protein [Alkalicoccus daliensis]SDN19372.1 hypothetical protein SAMN04488053_10159 [Alkalicoccus daliensis]
MKFILYTLLTIVILYCIAAGAAYIFNFQLINAVFITGLLGCFFTYGGSVSVLGEGAASAGSLGNYVPGKIGNSFIGSISPFFFGAFITVLSTMLLLL